MYSPRLLHSELKRRRVFRVAAVYAVVGWLVIQVAETTFPYLNLPAWTVTAIIALVVLGFPLAVILSWMFDLTGEGVVRTDPPDLLATGSESSRQGPVPAAPHPRSVAALPFTNLSGDADNEYFSDGVTEEILSRLAQIHDLRVVSRTSILRYKRTERPLKEIAAELSVANIVEGSVRRVGSRVRITAQLIEASTDTHLWAESYDRELHDIFEVQSEVAISIARALAARITTAETARVEKVPTRDLAAYELYLRAGHHLGRLTSADLRSAITLYQEAVRRDDQFALAYAGIANANLKLPYDCSVHPRSVFEPSRSAVDRALLLDPELAEAHAADAAIRLHYEWDWPGVERALRRALSLNHNSAWIHIWAGVHAGVREQFEDAISSLDQALALDPFSSLGRYMKSIVLVQADRAEEAVPVAHALTRHDPSGGFGHYVLGYALQALGRTEEAIISYDRSLELLDRHELPLAGIASAHAAAGRLNETRRIFDELRSRAEHRWVDPCSLAWTALALGEVDLALDYFERAEAERAFMILWMRPSTHLPELAAFRAHPRFQAILHRIWPDEFPAPRHPSARLPVAD